MLGLGDTILLFVVEVLRGDRLLPKVISTLLMFTFILILHIDVHIDVYIYGVKINQMVYLIIP